MRAKLTPEFALAAACCRWPPSAERRALITSLVSGVNWSLFTAVVRRHRVEGLAWAALHETGIAMPRAQADLLRAEAVAIACQNLALASESQRIHSAFEASGVPLLFVKGLTLAKLAYGGLSLKKGWDIDLLVAPKSVGGAADVLCELGYMTCTPHAASRQQLQTWHNHSKESVWRNRQSGHFVELHTELTDNSSLLPQLGIDSGSRHVEVANGVLLPTLPPDELFAYLCVHGASSAWFRLKWLADFAALANRDEEDLLRLYRRSQELGAGRSAAQALLLSADLLGMNLPSSMETCLRASRANRTLVAAAERLLDGGAPAREIHTRFFGTWAIHWTQLLLLPGWRFAFKEGRRQLQTICLRFCKLN